MGELVFKLKPWVTTFSEAIKFQYKHGDELCVGGVIKKVFSLPGKITNEVEKKVEYDSKEDMVHITLDDDVGEISLMIPHHIYETLNGQHAFLNGMVVLAYGKFFCENSLKKTLGYPSLICWDMQPLSELKMSDSSPTDNGGDDSGVR